MLLSAAVLSGCGTQKLSWYCIPVAAESSIQPPPPLRLPPPLSHLHPTAATAYTH